MGFLVSVLDSDPNQAQRSREQPLQRKPNVASVRQGLQGAG